MNISNDHTTDVGDMEFIELSLYNERDLGTIGYVASITSTALTNRDICASLTRAQIEIPTRRRILLIHGD